MAHLPAAALLLLALLVAVPGGPGVAARLLAQAPTDAPPAAGSGGSLAAAEASLSPGPESPYGGPRTDACVQLTNYAGQACSVESDTSESAELHSAAKGTCGDARHRVRAARPGASNLGLECVIRARHDAC